MSKFVVKIRLLCILGFHNWTNWEQQVWHLDEQFGGGWVNRMFRGCRRCGDWQVKNIHISHNTVKEAGN